MTFACNPDESRWPSRAVLGEGVSVRRVRAASDREIAECDDQGSIGTMLVQLAESGEKVMARLGPAGGALDYGEP